MNGLISAIQFITILPVSREHDVFNTRQMIPFLPVVGLLIGVLLSVLDLLLMQFWPASSASMVDVLFLAIITGALHLDGLGDTADGLFSHRKKEDALRIMKDSRVGVMGVVTIVCMLMIKWVGISGIETNRALLLILVPAYARAGMLCGIRFLPYGRTEGTGKAFFEEPLVLRDFWALGLLVLLSGFLSWTGLWLIVFFVLCTGVVLWFYRKKMGCITGDMLGALCEVLESVLFFMLSMGALQ